MFLPRGPVWLSVRPPLSFAQNKNGRTLVKPCRRGFSPGGGAAGLARKLFQQPQPPILDPLRIFGERRCAVFSGGNGAHIRRPPE